MGRVYMILAITAGVLAVHGGVLPGTRGSREGGAPLTYMDVHLTALLPVLVLLGLIYSPVLGRRDALKMLWLCFMATLYTTPWDNWILQHSGWSYPPGSILGRIYLVPIEEHLFFLVQSIMLVLLHSIVSHPKLLPSGIRRIARSASSTANSEATAGPQLVQSLRRRPLAAAVWALATVAGMLLVHEAHDLRLVDISLGLGERAFYLGWILIWVSPVVGFLTYLGGSLGREEVVALGVGTAWLWGVDTYAIRGGAWSISGDTTLQIDLWRGLPLEEALFFLLVSYLLVISCSLMAHLHTLMLLCPSLPVCPSRYPHKHIYTLFDIALCPPRVDARLIRGLADAEETLRIGSKSFQVAKLAFGREMRIGLVAVYAWCRVTDDLIDNTSNRADQHRALHIVRQHLHAAFSNHSSQADLDAILDGLPDLPPSSRSAFYIFSNLIPRLCPIEPFIELCKGYETDLHFRSHSPSLAETGRGEAMSRPDSGVGAVGWEVHRKRDGSFASTFALEQHLPIRTTADLMQYADDVAGSIAAAICYLAWSVLESDLGDERGVRRPVDQLQWTKALHGTSDPEKSREAELLASSATNNSVTRKRARIVSSAREMGRALQLVNIARDVAKDAAIGRLYIPLSHFSSGREILNVLQYTSTPALSAPSASASVSTSVSSHGNGVPVPVSVLTPSPRPEYAKYNLPLLDMADTMRRRAVSAIEDLPRTARGGTRAMVASYFEIGAAVRRDRGSVDERGVRVSKVRRAMAAARAMWMGGGGV